MKNLGDRGKLSSDASKYIVYIRRPQRERKITAGKRTLELHMGLLGEGKPTDEGWRECREKGLCPNRGPGPPTAFRGAEWGSSSAVKPVKPPDFILKFVLTSPSLPELQSEERGFPSGLGFRRPELE